MTCDMGAKNVVTWDIVISNLISLRKLKFDSDVEGKKATETCDIAIS